jgi:uncharacterized membrane protein
MDKKKIGFFEETANSKSYTRLASAVLIGAGVLIALLEVNYCMWINTKYEIHVLLIDSLITAGVTGKVVQKIFGETKDTTQNPNEN